MVAAAIFAVSAYRCPSRRAPQNFAPYENRMLHSSRAFTLGFGGLCWRCGVVARSRSRKSRDRARPAAAGARAEPDSHGQHRAGHWLADRARGRRRRRAFAVTALAGGPGPSALGVRAAQRRRAGGREQRAAQARRRPRASRARCMKHGDEEGRRRRAQRQPHHLAARRRRRRRGRNAQRLPAGPELALRHGAGRQRTVHRQLRTRSSRCPYAGRPDPHQRHAGQGDRPARRADQPPLDQERHRQPRTAASST